MNAGECVSSRGELAVESIAGPLYIAGTGRQIPSTRRFILSEYNLYSLLQTAQRIRITSDVVLQESGRLGDCEQ